MALLSVKLIVAMLVCQKTERAGGCRCWVSLTGMVRCQEAILDSAFYCRQLVLCLLPAIWGANALGQGLTIKQLNC